MLKNRQAAVVLQVLVQPHPGTDLAQDAGERRLADLERLAPQIRAVELQQVEGVEKRLRLVASAEENVEAGESRRVSPASRRGFFWGGRCATKRQPPR